MSNQKNYYVVSTLNLTDNSTIFIYYKQIILIRFKIEK